MGSEDVASHLQASHEGGRNMGGLQEQDCTAVTEKLEEDGFAAVDRKNCE